MTTLTRGEDPTQVMFATSGDRDRPLTVEAGTLLARCPVGGVGRLAAGRGTQEALAGGVATIRAAVDGRPHIAGSAVVVDEGVRVSGLAEGEAVSVFGSLEIAGGLPEGARALASGRLVVEGNVERSHVEGGRGVAIRGSCVGSRIRAGILCGIYARLLAVLRDADADMASVSAMADQLVASAPGGGRLVPADEAVEAVLATRFPRLDPVLAAASRLARGRESGVPEGIVAAIVEAATVIHAGAAGEPAPPVDVARAAEVLGEAMRLMRTVAGRPADMSVSYLQTCRVEVAGSLILTGPGAYNVDATVAGDLRAVSPGAIVRGGVVRVGGVVVARELGSSGGAPMRVILEGGRGRRRLSADRAHPGVEVLCGVRRIVIEATALNLEVGFDEENRVVCSEDLLD